MRLIAIAENNKCIGEGHGRAKLSDHDVELMPWRGDKEDLCADIRTAIRQAFKADGHGKD